MELPKIQRNGGRGKSAETKMALAAALASGEWEIFRADVGRGYAGGLRKAHAGYKFAIRKSTDGTYTCYVKFVGLVPQDAPTVPEVKQVVDPATCTHPDLSVPAGKTYVCYECQADVKGPFNLRAAMVAAQALRSIQIATEE